MRLPLVGTRTVDEPAAGSVPHSPAEARRRVRLTRGRRLTGVGPIAEGTVPATAGRRNRVYRQALVVGDTLAAIETLGLVALLAGLPIGPISLLAIPALVVLNKLAGLYDRDELLLRKSTLEEAPSLFAVVTLFTLVAWVSLPADSAIHTGRERVILLWLGLFVLLVIHRRLARTAARSMASSERCIVIGDEVGVSSVREKLDANPRAFDVVRCVVIDDRPEVESTLGAIPGSHDLPLLVRRLDAHRVIFVPSSLNEESVLEVVRSAKAAGVQLSIVPRLFEAVGSSVEFDELDGIQVLGVRRFGLSRSSELGKRGVDVTASIIGLILLAPLLALIALTIRRCGGRPTLYRQARVGKDGRTFTMFKFRTMVAGADLQQADLRDLNETDGLFKIAADPRVTAIGRRLRRTSLDELPQLWNVLRGEMSLVGPRPLVLEEDREVIGWRRRRLHLKPGMTGPWQVLGSSRVPLREMVIIDYLYVANWSLWVDIKILLRTMQHVFGSRGL